MRFSLIFFCLSLLAVSCDKDEAISTCSADGQFGTTHVRFKFDEGFDSSVVEIKVDGEQFFVQELTTEVEESTTNVYVDIEVSYGTREILLLHENGVRFEQTICHTGLPFYYIDYNTGSNTFETDYTRVERGYN